MSKFMPIAIFKMEFSQWTKNAISLCHKNICVSVQCACSSRELQLLLLSVTIFPISTVLFYLILSIWMGNANQNPNSVVILFFEVIFVSFWKDSQESISKYQNLSNEKYKINKLWCKCRNSGFPIVKISQLLSIWQMPFHLKKMLLGDLWCVKESFLNKE